MEKLIFFIANVLGIKAEDISGETELRDLAEDSLDFIELIIQLEEEYNVEIEEEDIDKLITVKDLFEYIDADSQSQCGKID